MQVLCHKAKVPQSYTDMGTREQPRKPAGTPVGGQFAPTAHNEANIDLSSQAKPEAQKSEMRVLSDGTREWRRADGTLHREEGPAIERPDGTREWWQDGKLHREGGPAVERANGTRVWYRDDEFVRRERA